MQLIELTGEVGGPDFCMDQVKQLPSEPVHVVVNSGGGCTVTGFAIAAQLTEHAHPVTAEIIHAGSAAVLPALAAGHRTIRGGGSFFLHCCSGVTVGNAAAMQTAADRMREQDQAYAELVSQRTGQELQWILDAMEKETSLPAETAVRLGFAHEITGTVSEPPAHKADPLKSALAAMTVQQRAQEPEGRRRLSQAMPAALSLSNVAKALDHATPEIAPGEAAQALNAFAEGQRRESEIRHQLALKLQRMRNQSGIICWPIRTTWTCGECHATNYHPPHRARLATPCRECGFPTTNHQKEPNHEQCSTDHCQATQQAGCATHLCTMPGAYCRDR